MNNTKLIRPHILQNFSSMKLYFLSILRRFNLVSPQTFVLKIVINNLFLGGARGVMAIVVGNGHGDTSSNPGRD